MNSEEPYFANQLTFIPFCTFSTVSMVYDIIPVGDTRKWAGRDETDFTKFVQAVNQLLLVGQIPLVNCTLC